MVAVVIAGLTASLSVDDWANITQAASTVVVGSVGPGIFANLLGAIIWGIGGVLAFGRTRESRSEVSAWWATPE